VNPYERFKAECAAEVEAMRADTELSALSRAWMDRAAVHRYSYHFDWLGRPVIQHPQDIVAFQELVWRIRPDLIVETGVAHGGSLVMFASFLAMLDLTEAAESGGVVDPSRPTRRVLGVDIDIRAHNRAALEAHPLRAYIDLVQGSSVDDDVAARVRAAAAGRPRVMVVLDSNHTHEHVLRELELYAPLVTPGSYCVVCDTVIEDMPADAFPDRPWGHGDNPKTAVWAYLRDHPEFSIDHSIDGKLGVTVAPDGFLRRAVSAPTDTLPSAALPRL
jgi:cephalosporin hydroxylase